MMLMLSRVTLRCHIAKLVERVLTPFCMSMKWCLGIDMFIQDLFRVVGCREDLRTLTEVLNNK